MIEQRLREERIARGLSQDDLANALHITRQAYTMYEQGKRRPNFEALITLSRVLGVSTDYLLGLTDSHQYVSEMSGEEAKLISDYRQLDARGRQSIQSRVLFERDYYSVTPPPSGASPPGPSISGSR